METKKAIVAARSGFIPLSPIWPIARLIDVRAHDDGGMVGHEPDRDGIDKVDRCRPPLPACLQGLGRIGREQ